MCSRINRKTIIFNEKKLHLTEDFVFSVNIKKVLQVLGKKYLAQMIRMFRHSLLCMFNESN